jgi:transposase InsO family protein
MILLWLDQAVAQGARLQAACATVGLTERTVQRWRQQGAQGSDDRRRGPRTSPRHTLAEQERQDILDVLHSPRFRDASPKTVVPTLADEGVYLGSESTFYRILRAKGEQAHRGRARPPSPRPIPTHTALGPNQVWSWDITYLPTTVRGMFFFLYLVVDIWSRRIMSWTVRAEESGEHAATMITAACIREKVSRDTLTLHSDNGAPMRGATLLATLQRLGVMPSFSRPSVSDDNPFSEALFRTLKYAPWWPSKPFFTLDEAATWVADFVRWYNLKHLHSGIGFVTPDARHHGQDRELLQARRGVYERAKQEHPARWTGATRSWSRPEEVSLNACHRRRSSAPGTVVTNTAATRSDRASRSCQKEARQAHPTTVSSNLPPTHKESTESLSS